MDAGKDHVKSRAVVRRKLNFITVVIVSVLEVEKLGEDEDGGQRPQKINKQGEII